MKRTRLLTPEEKILWNYITRNDRRLHPAPPELEEAPLPSPAQLATYSPAPAKPAVHNTPLPPSLLLAGDYRHVDGALAQRMRRGRYRPDRTIDLHGMDRIEAQDAFAQAINAALKRGSRMLLVITGKGRLQAGVLKSLLPMWINLSDLRPHVLAFDTARPEHGGEGAYYVLLKRRRDS